MTQEKYREMNNLETHNKHVKQWYRVWRVLGPAGPVETLDVFGKQEARELCRGCWDYEIFNSKGECIR